MSNEVIESKLEAALKELNAALMNDDCPKWLSDQLTTICSTIGYAVDELHYGGSEMK
jgi:hypothetical protein